MPAIPYFSKTLNHLEFLLTRLNHEVLKGYNLGYGEMAGT